LSTVKKAKAAWPYESSSDFVIAGGTQALGSSPILYAVGSFTIKPPSGEPILPSYSARAAKPAAGAGIIRCFDLDGSDRHIRIKNILKELNLTVIIQIAEPRSRT